MDNGITTLILGSFPGQESLRQEKYYAHPQNQFWRLMSAILREPLPDMAYDARLAALLRHRIGLWDVIATCRRPGSLDSDIRDEAHNDFAFLKHQCPQLRRVCFNGLKAARLANVFESQGYRCTKLPSSSPAFTLAFADKLACWKTLLGSDVEALRRP